MSGITPVFGLDEWATTEAVRAATLAPSVCNTQPWLFDLSADRVIVRRDPGRVLPVIDPDGREALLSCGAAVHNLRLALAGHGVATVAVTVPDDGCGARTVITAAGTCAPDDDLRALIAAIPHRRTNRGPFDPHPVPAAQLGALRTAAAGEGADLLIPTDPGVRAAIRGLITRAYREQRADPAFVAEFAHWTGRRPDSPDGVPVIAGGPAPEPQDEWVLRDFTDGHAAPRTPGKDFEPDPVIAVLRVPGDRPVDCLRAGRALQAVLLRATVLGLAASFLSQVIEVADRRRDLAGLLGRGLSPLAVLRLGFALPGTPTPRRHPGAAVTGHPG